MHACMHPCVHFLTRIHLINSTGTSKSSSTTIQGRGLNEFFYAEGNTTTRIRPILHHLDIPVRAVVLPITDTRAVESIAQALNDFLPEHQYTDTIWYQNLSLLHSTLYHASTHLGPVPASAEQVEAEYAAIVNAANALCPVIAVLDSVVYTESGTFLALWHIAQGGTISSEEPATIRNKLRQALPHASKKQVVLDDVILHTTLARVAISDVHPSITTILATAAAEITVKLCGLKAQLEVMWYVEEYDVLALALNGRLQVRNVPLRGCATP